MAIKAVVALQAVQSNKKIVDTNLVEQPLKQDLLGCQDEAENVHAQVKEIAQQYEDFKVKTTEYTPST